MPRNLNNQQLTEIDQVGQKIKQTLTNIVNSFPIQARTITGMSSWLNASKTTCQRVIESINAKCGIESIIALPGPSGLQKFLNLTLSKNNDPQALSTHEKTMTVFQELLASHNVSHSALKNLLKNDQKPQNFEKVAEVDARKKLFEASSSLLNEYIDVNLTLFLHKENSKKPEFLQQSVLSYYKGCRFGEDARPLVVLVNPNINKAELEKICTISTQDNLTKLPVLSFVKELTSENILNSCKSLPNSTGKLIMNDYLDKSTLSDVAILKHYDQDLISPSYGGKFAGLTGVEIRNPTRKLIHLCFMKKTLAIKSLVCEKVLSITAGFKPITENDSWFDRLKTEADITILQPQADYDHKLNIDGANQLIETFFSLTNNDPKDYLGYLMRVDYPIWSSAYLMHFPVSVDSL